MYRMIYERKSIRTTIGNRMKKWIRNNNTYIYVTSLIVRKIEGKPEIGNSKSSHMKQIMLDVRNRSSNESKQVAIHIWVCRSYRTIKPD